MKNRLEEYKDYEIVIGLEVHIQLRTRSKLFCTCPVEYNARPNQNVCPRCLGLPGTLPVLNKRAVELAVIAAKNLNCRINIISRFARKHYFYPDFPKGYQITQYDEPLAQHGYLKFNDRAVRIRRLHLEEDTARLMYKDNKTLVDFNRAGIPLIEIVTEPIIQDIQLVERFLKELRIILMRLRITDGDMAKGQMRCEPNISLRMKNKKRFGTRVEIKNINSFVNLRKALRFEIARQKNLLKKGQKIVQQTMGWEDRKKQLVCLRLKEKSADYRYFPEPDLLPLRIDDRYIASLSKSADVLMPDKIREELKNLKIPSEQIETLININGYEYFEEIKRYYKLITKREGARMVINFLTTEILGYLNQNKLELKEFDIPARWIAQLLAQVTEQKVTTKTGKELFKMMIDEHRPPEELIKRKGLARIEDLKLLEQTVDSVIKKNQDIVEKIRRGKDGAIGVLVGEVMKLTRGRLDPKKVSKMIAEKILRGRR